MAEGDSVFEAMGGTLIGPQEPRLSSAPDPHDRYVKWSPSDLDRCEHGRHSIDNCYDCPSGESSGNPFLINQRNAGHTMRTRDGQTEVRIGTMVHGEPIWVVVRDKPRETGSSGN